MTIIIWQWNFAVSACLDWARVCWFVPWSSHIAQLCHAGIFITRIVIHIHKIKFKVRSTVLNSWQTHRKPVQHFCLIFLTQNQKPDILTQRQTDKHNLKKETKKPACHSRDLCLFQIEIWMTFILERLSQYWGLFWPSNFCSNFQVLTTASVIGSDKLNHLYCNLCKIFIVN